MTLSDVKGDRSYEVLAVVFEAVGNMAKDKNVYKYFEPEATPKGMSQGQHGAVIMFDLIAAICRDHKKDISEIMASIGDISVEEYEEDLTMGKLVTDVMDLLNDPMVQELFFSQTPTNQNTKTNSGSVSASTTKKKAPKAS